MRSLYEMSRDGRDARAFVRDFIEKPHRGDVDMAKDHWTRTVQHIADRAKELEGMSPDEAERTAELTAQTLAFSLAQAYKCWACGQ